MGEAYNWVVSICLKSYFVNQAASQNESTDGAQVSKWDGG